VKSLKKLDHVKMKLSINWKRDFRSIEIRSSERFPLQAIKIGDVRG
jgi:hypothetical protein